MSKKKKGRQDKDDAENRDDDDVGEGAEIAEKIRGQVIDGGADLKAQIHRIRKGENDKYLDQVDAGVLSDNPMGYIKGRWGGGRFKIGLRRKGKWVKGHTSMMVEIEGEEITEKIARDDEEVRRLEELEKRVEQAVAASKTGDISMADLVKLQMELSREQLRELRNPPAAAATSNIPEMVVSMITAIQQSQQPLLAALIERGSKPDPDPLDQMDKLVSMMTMIRELTAPPERSSDAKGWDRVVEQLASPLAGMMNQHVANQAAGVAPSSTMPPGHVPSSRPNPPEPEDMNGNKPIWWRFVGPMVPELTKFAQTGRDPEIIADFVAETRIPDEYLGFVYEALSSPEFLPTLHELAPMTKPHSAWFKAFAGRIIQHVAYIEERDADVDAGDDPDPNVSAELGQTVAAEPLDD